MGLINKYTLPQAVHYLTNLQKICCLTHCNPKDSNHQLAMYQRTLLGATLESEAFNLIQFITLHCIFAPGGLKSALVHARSAIPES